MRFVRSAIVSMAAGASLVSAQSTGVASSSSPSVEPISFTGSNYDPSAVASNEAAALQSSLSGILGGIIPGGVGTLAALGFPIPGLSSSSLSGPVGQVYSYLGPILNTPIGSAVLGGLLSGNGISSVESAFSNVTLNSVIPQQCQQAITQAVANRTDCGPLMSVLYNNTARQSNSAVGAACTQSSGCLAAVQQAVTSNAQVCTADINVGIPGFSSMSTNYLALVLDGLCVKPSNSSQQYCLPQWDQAITKLSSGQVSAFTNTSNIDQFCNVPCRTALAANIKNNPNFTAIGNNANIDSVFNALCTVDPYDNQYCASELAQNVGTNFDVDAAKFCTPCARIEMALGNSFTNASISTYNTVIEQVEGFACATDSTGKLCSNVIYDQFNNASSGLAAFTDSGLQQSCALALIQNQCPSQCAQPLQQFISSLGPCGGLFLSNSTFGYSRYLPSPFNSLVAAIINSCGVRAVTQQPPAAALTLQANLVYTNTSIVPTSQKLATALSISPSQVVIGSQQQYMAPAALPANSLYNTTAYSQALTNATSYIVNITGFTQSQQVGVIAQRMTDLIYAMPNIFSNASYVTVQQMQQSNSASTGSPVSGTAGSSSTNSTSSSNYNPASGPSKSDSKNSASALQVTAAMLATAATAVMML